MLGQPAAHAHDRAIRWRQLVEIVARAGPTAGGELVDQAITEIDRDKASVDERVRMAAARSIADLPMPLPLICVFAADRLGAAAPLLAAARLTPSEWSEVSVRASSECARFIASLRGEPATPTIPPAAPGAPDDATAMPSISEVVARIERLREAREQSVWHDATPLPDAEHPRPEPEVEQVEQAGLFRWECDEAGDISWVDGAPRGALIGRSIGNADPEEGLDERVERAFSKRLPFRDASLEVAEGTSIAGLWKISGRPAFEPSSGRFTGYRGLAERPRQEKAEELAPIPIRDPVTLRELAHEIRTPLNAIIGFAEIISGQYLGAAQARYRERAQEIVRQARLLLDAVDDLDLAARLHSRTAPAAATELAPVVSRVTEDLEGRATFGLIGVPRTSLDETLCERLISRFCKAVAAQTDKPLTFFVQPEFSNTVVSVDNPALADDEADLGLRLVTGLARIAGGDLLITDSWIKLLLPRP